MLLNYHSQYVLLYTTRSVINSWWPNKCIFLKEDPPLTWSFRSSKGVAIVTVLEPIHLAPVIPFFFFPPFVGITKGSLTINHSNVLASGSWDSATSWRLYIVQLCFYYFSSKSEKFNGLLRVSPLALEKFFRWLESNSIDFLFPVGKWADQITGNWQLTVILAL